jgi:hypothetical protein
LIQSKAPPEAYYYTTFMTGILDIGVVAPALIIAGALILRRTPLGYLLAATMLVFTGILGPNLAVGGTLQVLAEVITPRQAMAFTVPFVILALIDIGFTIRLFSNFSEVDPETHTTKARKENLNEHYSTGR